MRWQLRDLLGAREGGETGNKLGDDEWAMTSGRKRCAGDRQIRRTPRINAASDPTLSTSNGPQKVQDSAPLRRSQTTLSPFQPRGCRACRLSSVPAEAHRSGHGEWGMSGKVPLGADGIPSRFVCCLSPDARHPGSRHWCQNNMPPRTMAVTARYDSDEGGSIGQERAPLGEPNRPATLRTPFWCHASCARSPSGPVRVREDCRRWSAAA